MKKCNWACEGGHAFVVLPIDVNQTQCLRYTVPISVIPWFGTVIHHRFLNKSEDKSCLIWGETKPEITIYHAIKNYWKRRFEDKLQRNQVLQHSEPWLNPKNETRKSHSGFAVVAPSNLNPSGDCAYTQHSEPWLNPKTMIEIRESHSGFAVVAPSNLNRSLRMCSHTTLKTMIKS